MINTYVIVGASLAGATAAITLREEGADGAVILIGAEREPPYERPPLSKAYLRGRNRRVSIPGADLEGIYSLRTVEDADRIRAEMMAGRRAIVVGMGFIGSEVAASLRQKGLEVVVIEPSKTPLFRVLGEAVGQTIAELHRAHGVRTIFEDTVAAFEGTRRVACVVTKGGLRLECDFVVVGIGIEPAVDMLGGSGIHVDRR